MIGWFDVSCSSKFGVAQTHQLCRRYWLGMSTIQNRNVPPENKSNSWSWANIMLVILLAINLKQFLHISSSHDNAGSDKTLAKPPAANQTMIDRHVADLDKGIWMCICILLVVAFAMGCMIGKHGRTTQNIQNKEVDHAPRNGTGSSQSNSENDVGSPDQNSDAEEIDPDNNNTEGSHHEIYFGKAKFPVTANPEHIITEMGKMVLLQGEHQGRTFHQVWNIDRKKTYTKWLKSRLGKVDIAYVAFTLYAEMKNILEQ
jgi:hypothetical protein